MAAYLMSAAGNLQTAFLADAMLTVFSHKEGHEIVPGDQKTQKSAAQFLESVEKGLFLAIGAEEEEESELAAVEPASRAEYSRAFKEAMAVWTSRSWQRQHPGFLITKEGLLGEIERYQNVLEDLLDEDKSTQDIPGFAETKAFFAVLIRVTLQRHSEAT